MSSFSKAVGLMLLGTREERPGYSSIWVDDADLQTALLILRLAGFDAAYNRCSALSERGGSVLWIGEDADLDRAVNTSSRGRFSSVGTSARSARLPSLNKTLVLELARSEYSILRAARTSLR
jgi:hypothetical protein